MPTLVAILVAAERAKGAPLTEAEVLAVGDDCPVIILRPTMALSAAKERGYTDIDP